MQGKSKQLSYKFLSINFHQLSSLFDQEQGKSRQTLTTYFSINYHCIVSSYYFFLRELKEEWIRAKYIDKMYFSWKKCISTVTSLDDNVLRALDKVPDHHVGEVKRKTKKKLGRKRPNLKSSLFRRFSKGDKRNLEEFKQKIEKSRVSDEKASGGLSSATTSPELSPEMCRSVLPRVRSPVRSKSPLPDSSDESGVSFREHDSGNATEDGERGIQSEETVKTSTKPTKGVHGNFLKARLIEVDRNSVGSCYDNLLKNDDDSEASESEADAVSDFLESDVEPGSAEGTGKDNDVIESDGGVDDDEHLARESRAREILKSVPPNLVSFVYLSR